MKIVDHRYPN